MQDSFKSGELLHFAEYLIKAGDRERYSCSHHLDELKLEIDYNDGKGEVVELSKRVYLG